MDYVKDVTLRQPAIGAVLDKDKAQNTIQQSMQTASQSETVQPLPGVLTPSATNITPAPRGLELLGTNTTACQRHCASAPSPVALRRHRSQQQADKRACTVSPECRCTACAHTVRPNRWRRATFTELVVHPTQETLPGNSNPPHSEGTHDRHPRHYLILKRHCKHTAHKHTGAQRPKRTHIHVRVP